MFSDLSLEDLALEAREEIISVDQIEKRCNMVIRGGPERKVIFRLKPNRSRLIPRYATVTKINEVINYRVKPDYLPVCMIPGGRTAKSGVASNIPVTICSTAAFRFGRS